MIYGEWLAVLMIRKFLIYLSALVLALLLGVIAATIIINSITSRPDVPLTTSTSVLTPSPSIDSEIITPLMITSVCEDFDNGLWFWDMYLERSQGFNEDESYALMLAMSNEVHTDCLHHQDRLPSELLGD